MLSRAKLQHPTLLLPLGGIEHSRGLSRCPSGDGLRHAERQSFLATDNPEPQVPVLDRLNFNIVSMDASVRHSRFPFASPSKGKGTFRPGLSLVKGWERSFSSVSKGLRANPYTPHIAALTVPLLLALAGS